ncbi:type I-E CRISPR-associated protein Cas6/Cse3/CasE [Streptomyces nodosus]|uniref:type I-E CRISPR-associated protein Cas6/Cse3/CasE n=1 Tax=Streptomyces nodosus TaxID=40318 RepID=UPI003455FA31
MTTVVPPLNPAWPPVEAGLTVWRSVVSLSKTEQKKCQDVHRLHQLVLAGFRPSGLKDAVHTPPESGILYVADRHTAKRETTTRRLIAGRPQQLIVQSPRRPDWQHLLDTGRITEAGSSTVTLTYHVGDTVPLRVIANPTYKDSKTKKRRIHESAESCGDWFRRHLARHGVDVVPHHVAVGQYERLTGIDSTGNRLHFICREIRAIGTVHDPDSFNYALRTGIGRGKAYGCGFLHAHTRTC